MQLVLERRAERSTPIAVASPLIAFALTIVTPAEESLLTVNHRLRREDSMRLPGAVGIDFRDRRGVRRGASEILTSLMLVYVANLGMDYVVCGPGAIAGPATHRSSSSAMSRARLERLIEQGDVPFITQPAARASDLDQIAGHAQGIMLRRVPRYARSIGAMKAANSIVADRKRTKASQMPKIVNLALQGDGGHGAFTWGMLDRLLEEEALHFEGIAGTSAGAVDAVVLADGLAAGGREGVRDGITA